MESIDFISFDFVLLGIILLSGLIAFFRGFIQESLSLALWIFAFAAAMFLDEYLDPYISVYITNDELKRIASLFIIFTGIIFSGGFAIKIIKNLTFTLSDPTFEPRIGTSIAENPPCLILRFGG